MDEPSQADVEEESFIAELARTLEVPPNFVQSVLALVQSKGISLEDDSERWEEILVRSFTNRAETHRICNDLQAALKCLTTELEDLRKECLQVAEQARRAEERMLAIAARWPKQVESDKAQKKDSWPILMPWRIRPV